MKNKLKWTFKASDDSVQTYDGDVQQTLLIKNMAGDTLVEKMLDPQDRECTIDAPTEDAVIEIVGNAFNTEARRSLYFETYKTETSENERLVLSIDGNYKNITKGEKATFYFTVICKQSYFKYTDSTTQAKKQYYDWYNIAPGNLRLSIKKNDEEDFTVIGNLADLGGYYSCVLNEDTTFTFRLGYGGYTVDGKIEATVSTDSSTDEELTVEDCPLGINLYKGENLKFKYKVKYGDTEVIPDLVTMQHGSLVYPTDKYTFDNNVFCILYDNIIQLNSNSMIFSSGFVKGTFSFTFQYKNKTVIKDIFVDTARLDVKLTDFEYANNVNIVADSDRNYTCPKIKFEVEYGGQKISDEQEVGVYISYRMGISPLFKDSTYEESHNNWCNQWYNAGWLLDDGSICDYNDVQLTTNREFDTSRLLLPVDTDGNKIDGYEVYDVTYYIRVYYKLPNGKYISMDAYWKNDGSCYATDAYCYNQSTWEYMIPVTFKDVQYHLYFYSEFIPTSIYSNVGNYWTWALRHKNKYLTKADGVTFSLSCTAYYDKYSSSSGGTIGGTILSSTNADDTSSEESDTTTSGGILSGIGTSTGTSSGRYPVGTSTVVYTDKDITDDVTTEHSGRSARNVFKYIPPIPFVNPLTYLRIKYTLRCTYNDITVEKTIYVNCNLNCSTTTASIKSAISTEYATNIINKNVSPQFSVNTYYVDEEGTEKHIYWKDMNERIYTIGDKTYECYSDGLEKYPNCTKNNPLVTWHFNYRGLIAEVSHMATWKGYYPIVYGRSNTDPDASLALDVRKINLVDDYNTKYKLDVVDTEQYLYIIIPNKITKTEVSYDESTGTSNVRIIEENPYKVELTALKDSFGNIIEFEDSVALTTSKFADTYDQQEFKYYKSKKTYKDAVTLVPTITITSTTD